jgi:DNA-binding PadR family transcriptional regulator
MVTCAIGHILRADPGVQQKGSSVRERELLGGMIRFHILFHACREPIFGHGIILELARHGYKLSAGTIYPILHGMEKEGYLISEETLMDGRKRRAYTATPEGVEVLSNAKAKVWELFRELFEEELQLRRTTEPKRKK